MSDTPKTLLQMAGVPNTPPAMEDAVLLLIDAQNEYISGALALPGAAPAVDVLASVLAFAGTNLQAVLEARGRKKLIIGGFMTHMCVSSTTRAALDLGWSSAVISDGCATRSLPSPTGGKVVEAEMLHEASLAGLSDRFAIIAPGSAF